MLLLQHKHNKLFNKAKQQATIHIFINEKIHNA